MLKELLKELKKYLDNNNIYDIIIYGSVARGKEKPEDIDILILFREFDEELFLELNKKYHVLAIKLEDIYTLSTLIISILAEGWSVKYEKPLRDVFGFKAYKLLEFKKIVFGTPSKKVLFYYFLHGRKDRNKTGLLEETKAEIVRIKPLLIKIPIENYEIFKTRLEAFIKTKQIEVEIEERIIIEI